MRTHVLIGLLIPLLAAPAAAGNIDDLLVAGDVDGAFAHVAGVEPPAARLEAFVTLCRGLVAVSDADPELAQRVADLARTGFEAIDQRIPAYVMTARSAARLESPQAAIDLLRFLLDDALEIPNPAFRADVLGAFLEPQLELDPDGVPATIGHIRTALGELPAQPRLDRSVGLTLLLHAAGRDDDAAAVIDDIVGVVDGLEPTELRITVGLNVARAMIDASARPLARPLLAAAARHATTLATPDQRTGALLQIAELQGEAGDHDGRRRTLAQAASAAADFADVRTRLSALLEVADQQAVADEGPTLTAALPAARALTPDRDRLGALVTIAEKLAFAGDRVGARAAMQGVDALFEGLSSAERSQGRIAHLRAWAVAGDTSGALAYVEDQHLSDAPAFWSPVLRAALACGDLEAAVTAADASRSDAVFDNPRTDRANRVIDRCLEERQFARALEMVERLATNNEYESDDGALHRRPMLIRIATAQHEAGHTRDAQRTFAQVLRMLENADDLLVPTGAWCALARAQADAGHRRDAEATLDRLVAQIDTSVAGPFKAGAYRSAAAAFVELDVETRARACVDKALAHVEPQDDRVRSGLATVLAVLGDLSEAERILTTTEARLGLGERLVWRDEHDRAREWAGRFTGPLRDDALLVVARTQMTRERSDALATTVGRLSDDVRGPIAEALGRETLFDRRGTLANQVPVVDALLPYMSDAGKIKHYQWLATLRASGYDLEGARDELLRFDAAIRDREDAPLLKANAHVQVALAHARIGAFGWEPASRRAHRSALREAADHLRAVRPANDAQRAGLVSLWGTLAEAATSLPDPEMLDLAYYRSRLGMAAIADPDERARAEAVVAQITQRRLDAVAAAGP